MSVLKDMHEVGEPALDGPVSLRAVPRVATSEREQGPRRRLWGLVPLPDDIDVIFDKDPAARNILEVLTYQGLHAVLLHRVAHWIWLRKVPVIPRIISQVARLVTAGIEIHPGATIGRRFFIDHGTGIVIGESAEIGDNVMLYHQVTLGATGWWKDMKSGVRKRHPTIEDNVVIGVGASILGPVTIGRGSKIGALALVLESVPANSTVVAAPAVLLKREGKGGRVRAEVLDYQI